MRFVSDELEGSCHDTAQILQVANFVRGHGLHQRVASRGRFVRSDDDAAPGGVGRHLAEQRVLAAAADDVDHVEPPIENRFERRQLVAIRERQTFQAQRTNWPGDSVPAGSLPRAKSAIFCSMSPGSLERRVRRIDERAKRPVLRWPAA